ncbi:Crp/Fnr family transcriptional regulator [Salinisphaera hydrothermalis]|uniref:Crp/FNR family transcriptional regulator n=1 Tax=Salinisphaera hydrothermalis (strain C41B8) TaxID=1304275 RepID=A0A084IKH3_SALHC|nr:helix-turn-helix domain-containing protein [Salinisphaera hydrothermalis]KEZ77207.1 Crp/FNR family transcriptional regulator [Salinisphaera hydrothermalis C41B8]
MPAELDGEALTRFEQRVWRSSRAVRAGEVLVRQGETIDALYALRVGSMKAFFDEPDGTERVLAFRYPGAIIGLAEPYQQCWSRSFAALENTWVCRIPSTVIDDVLQYQLIHLMSACLRREYQSHLTLALTSSTRRVVAFLLETSATFGALGQSAVRLRLPMTYLDIASYLGMRHESLSRTLGQLEKQGLIQKDGKVIELNDLARLRRMKDESTRD